MAFASVPAEPASPPAARPDTDRRVTVAPTNLVPPAKPESDRQPAPPDTKRKIETALTAAAIVAILIKASRDEYYPHGSPVRLSG